MVRSVAFWLLVIAGLSGCSEGAPTAVGESARAESAVSVPAPSQPTLGHVNYRQVQGNGTKGPLIEATVELFELDGRGFAQGAAFASTVTDDQGNWQLEVNRTDPVLVRISGGRYVDEADTNIESRRVVELSPEQFLESVLAPDSTSVAVTVFTQALLRKSRLETGLNEFASVLDANRQLFQSAYGFDVMATLPADPLSPAGSDEAIAYALNVGGVANAINALSIAAESALPEYAHIMAVVEDLIDCSLDGIGAGGQPVFASTGESEDESGDNTYGNLSLQQQALRFRNNNFSNYADTEPRPVNAAPCLQLGGTTDSTPPQFVQTAQSPTLEARTPAGVQLNDTQKQALREQFVATDDRAGVVQLFIDIPDQLPLGVTALVAMAEDDWGNRASLDWEVVVADTTAPLITGATEFEADAQGDLTPLVLVEPNVSDLVSLGSEISLISDAPAAFPVGPSEVTWTAVDAAGNVAKFVQLVTINSIPPETSDAPGVISTDSGDVDFSNYFFDPDGTTLTYSIDGLPAGTGLSLDPSTGVLTGEPTAADLAAQPLDVTITATDGQNSVNVQTTLNVVAPNEPPAFALALSELSVEEDFGTRTIDLQPLTVPVNEQDQVVTYAVTLAGSEPQSSPVEASFDADARRVVLTSVDNAFGSINVVVTANDGQASNSEFVQTVTVLVQAVNDVPEVIEAQALEVTVGQSVAVALSERVVDIEDEILFYEAEQLPAGLAVNADLLSGMALPADALSPEIPVRLRATDSDGASVEFEVTLRVTDPDQDGDGLSDYRELQAGFDPLAADSDGDGFGDSLEYVREIDPANETILFVGSGGNDALDGTSPQNRLATLDEASARLAALDPARAATVLIEKQSQGLGRAILSGRRRQLLGNVDFTSLQQALAVEDAASLPRMVSPQEPAVLFTGCQDCRVASIRIESGKGITVIDSDVTLESVHIVGTQGTDGGALYVLRSQVTAHSMLFAANHARQGGAVSLQEQSVLELTDSVLTGNRASVAGGAATVTESTLNAHNVWLSANTAPAGAALDTLESSVTLTNSTVAYHLLESIAASQLVRCRTAFLDPCSDAEGPIFRDTLVVGNRNLDQHIIDLDGVGALSEAVFVEPGRAGPGAIALTTSEPFGAAYMSSDLVTVNSGSRSSVEAMLESTFSQTDSVYTDQGIVDGGAHYRFPVRTVGLYRPVAQLQQQPDGTGLRPIDVRLLDLNVTPGEMRRLAISVLSDDVRSRAVSPGVLPLPLSTGRIAVPAVYIGRQVYRIWVTEEFDSSRDRLTLWLDDDSAGLDVSVVCDQLLCGSISLHDQSASSDTGGNLGSERVAPAIQPATPGLGN